MRKSVLTIGMIASLLSACSDIYYDRRETIALGADDHIASNMVEQMIDPWPRYVGNKNIPGNGERMQAAVDRYRRDCVIPPSSLDTTLLGAQQQQQMQLVAANCLPAGARQTATSFRGQTRIGAVNPRRKLGRPCRRNKPITRFLIKLA